MAAETYLAFVLTSVALILIPGPNVAVIVANSGAHGLRYGLATVAGTSAAMVFQLTATVFGLTGFLALAAHGFEWLRWLGVLYLAYLAAAYWLAPATHLDRLPEARSARRMFARGFLVSLTNPKTLLFYAAFLPQFVTTASDPTGELARLAAIFLVLAVTLDSVWAIAAHALRRFLPRESRLANRISGVILMAAAVTLAVLRRPGGASP